MIDGRFLESEDVIASVTVEVSGGPQYIMMVIDGNLATKIVLSNTVAASISGLR